MKKIFLFSQLVLCAALAAAQPVIAFDGGAAVSNMDITIWLLADNAITRYDIVLANPSSSVLEGEFNFKPKGNQNLDSFTVDGEARPAAAEGFAAALALPPKTTRRIQLVLEEKLQNNNGAYYYKLPAASGFKAGHFRLRAEILRQTAAPEIKESPFSNFEFVRRGGSYSAAFGAKDYELSGNLIFAAPAESAAKAYTYNADGNTYFFAAVPFEPATAAQRYMLKKISYDKTKFDEVYPLAPQREQDMLNIAGIIKVKEARLDLYFTAAGKPAFVRRVYIDRKARSPYARGVFLRAKAAARGII